MLPATMIPSVKFLFPLILNLQHSFAGAPAQHVFSASPWLSESAGSNEDTAWSNDMIQAIEAMQNEYFSIWHGTWPPAIDWTAAVLGTHLPATLSALSSLEYPEEANSTVLAHSHDHVREDLVNTYFSQTISFYYGQDWFSLRTQANDDMLWVVLGWLEAITFVQTHATNRHTGDEFPWYGERYIPAFAHRARIFWELASKGWDESLCGGGMIWNPRLAPYKNAITNELYIAASVSMYLKFPGDNNDSPFIEGVDDKFPAHDKKYLHAAIRAYDWLIASNMTNRQGLFVDGYHIEGWRGGRNPSNGTGKCDVRDEMVYTYNQGVVLTGQRGLFEATGNVSYLQDGHSLIKNVIRATGWNLESDRPEETKSWQGLGRLGVLEEKCDILGTCSQDGQTFKGIFFMHYAAFCRPLLKKEATQLDYEVVRKTHARNCRSYRSWVEHNAKAALMTKDSRGLFGMWWTEGLWERSNSSSVRRAESFGPQSGTGTDYRNEGIPDDDVWRIKTGTSNHNDDIVFAQSEMWRQLSLADLHDPSRNPLHQRRGPEIQSGGLAVLRAAFWHQAD